MGFTVFRHEIPGGVLVGNGVESSEQQGGKVWRFAEVRGNGGTGLDSSEEGLGLEDAAGDGVSGVVKLEGKTRVRRRIAG